ncbi:hypothetical protein [Psychrobacter alimentarius]|uniref:hypothetical protein n=1 Tax=Psychrobacter alimentarius TaxID=261164 RepID=UPI003FD64A96
MIAYNQAQKTVHSIEQQVSYAAEQLQRHGFDRYYNAMVGAYVSDVHKTLNYPTFANATNRAKNPLSSVEQAVMYTTLYGKSHFDRFKAALTQLMGANVRAATVKKTIHIIDYGCGQGIASLALLDYLKTYVNCDGFTLHFHLVEPSSTTLGLAEKMVKSMATHISAVTKVHLYHKNLADFLNDNPSELMVGDFTIHLFSNVLDIPAVQQLIPELSTHMTAIKGKQMVVGVGPQYSANYQGLMMLKQTLSSAIVKQDVANFCTESEIYSIKNNHWQHSTSYGVMLGLCFKNTALEEALEKVA